MKHIFLSLKWQAAISVSLILLLGVGLVTYFGQDNLEQTFLSQRDRVYQDRQQSLNTALETLQRQMTNIANHMQGVATRSALPSAQARLLSILEQNWDQLNFEWGLGTITLYSPQGEIISTLGSSVIEQLLPVELVMEISRAEEPKAQIRCSRSCWQMVAVPTLLDNDRIGVLVLSKDLSDVVLEFQSATAADVGILVAQTPEAQSLDLRSLESWQHNIVALTGTPASYAILKALSAEMPLSALSSRRPLQHWSTYDYEISLLRLADSIATGGASLIVLENVSADLHRLNSTLSDLFFTASVIFVLAEVALLWLLSVPMARLGRISSILPKLAGEHREGIMQELHLPKKKPRISNEIHELFDSAALLTSTLQQLDDKVKQRTRNLKSKGEELLKERNFVTTLLNNVQAIILTQNRDGKIYQLNAEGLKLFGLGQQGYERHNFLEFVEQVDRDTVVSGLLALFTGTAKQFHHEIDLHSYGEGTYFIDWHHSKLPESPEHEPLVLSVGLDLTARKQAETNLAWLADHDPLTELPNRRRFHIDFERILKKSKRSGRPGALIFCDIDQFKTINDTSGHPVGDRLLRQIANKLLRGIRDIDVLARLGGDEFAIIVEETDRDGAISLANNICEIMSDTDIVAGHTTHRVTLSMGIALFPEHGMAVDELMANADLSMYKAKAGGKAHNNWNIYTLDAPEKQWMREQVDWKARIQKALIEERFVLYYQPIYDIQKNIACHYEALVRMLDDQGDIIAPNMFIPVAEKTGLIYDIDRWVLKQAVKDLRDFSQQGRNVTLSVNLSATAVAKIDFIATIESLVNEQEVDRSRLIFELTETSAVEDLTATVEVIRKCRRLGYQFSLDDFGTGYASWFYLRQLPVDFVKIDGSFVQHLTNNEEDRLFVTAINNIAQGLGKKTVAEYVENAESLEILKEMGVDYAQGYYIGKPQPALLDNERVFPDVPQTIHRDDAISASTS